MATQCPVHKLRHIDAVTGRCGVCDHHNQTSLRAGRAKQRLAEKALSYDHDAGYSIITRPDGTIRPGAIVALIAKMESDPIVKAQVNLRMARPAGVSKERFGIAVRAAGKVPMLNANPDCLMSGVKSHPGKPPAVMKAKTRYVVKPLTLANAKGDRNSAFWGERLWSLCPLKYARGYVVVTDTGSFSKVFMDVGQATAAITASGWEITRKNV